MIIKQIWIYFEDGSYLFQVNGYKMEMDTVRRYINENCRQFKAIMIQGFPQLFTE